MLVVSVEFLLMLPWSPCSGTLLITLFMLMCLEAAMFNLFPSVQALMKSLSPIRVKLELLDNNSVLDY